MSGPPARIPRHIHVRIPPKSRRRPYTALFPLRRRRSDPRRRVVQADDRKRVWTHRITPRGV